MAESAERTSPGLSEVLPSRASSSPREVGWTNGRLGRTGLAGATEYFRHAYLRWPLLLVLVLVTSSASALQTQALVHQSTNSETNLRVSDTEGSECNTTLYDDWYYSPYSGALLTDLVDFWIFSDAELTNGQAMEVASSSCRVIMDTLRLDRAGRNGPVEDKYIYDAMCAGECTLSDAIREEVMELSSCTCLQLSTQPSELTYHKEGDWCVENSGRILCETFGQCGAWGCRISDFMCPRYEYNKHMVPHRGFGDCSGARGLWGRGSGPWDQVSDTAIFMLPSLVASLALGTFHLSRN